MKTRRRLREAMGFLVLGVLLGAPQPVHPALAMQDLMAALQVSPVREPTQAPDFTLQDLQGKAVSLRAFRGQVVLLNFWATWCVPCQWEMAELEKLYQAYQEKGFVVLAVALDAEGARTVEPFARERQLTYPILLDTRLEAARRYQIFGPPTTFLIDRQGRVIGEALGPREWAGEKAKALIRHLLTAS